MPATVMPGFTHLQTAQPITFGHHCLAYVEMLARDRGRFADASKRLNECPLGAAALGRHELRHRSRHDGEGAWLCQSRRPIRSTPCQIATLRWRHSLPLRSPPCICRGLPKRSCCGPRRSSASPASPTSTPPAPRSCRRSGTPTLPNWCAPRPDASPAPFRPAHGDEGTAARLCQGHAGGQGARVRRARCAQARACRHDRHGRRSRAGRACHEEGRRGAVTPPPPTSPTGWCASSHFLSARRITSPGAIVALADAKGVELEKLSLADLSRSSRDITKDAFSVLDVASSVKSRKSYGGTAPANVRREAKTWIKRLKKDGLIAIKRT